MQCLNCTFPRTPICYLVWFYPLSNPKHLLTFLVVPVTLTASRHCPAPTDTLPVHLKLLALDLDYVWQTNSNATASGRLNAAINPFARLLSLPYLTATDNAVGRFVSYHLVRRVSLISSFSSGKIYSYRQALSTDIWPLVQTT